VQVATNIGDSRQPAPDTWCPGQSCVHVNASDLVLQVTCRSPCREQNFTTPCTRTFDSSRCETLERTRPISIDSPYNHLSLST
jgi:hypothetical protein